MKENVIFEAINYFANDVKRINHALKVYGFAQTISLSEDISQKTRDIIGYAAILHDIGIKEAERKYNSSSGNYQETEGPPIARKILEKLNISEEIIDRVCYIIGNHHSYNKIDGVDFQILVEADFIVNIFEDDMSENSVKSVFQKIFKTETGKKILENMYNRNF